MALLLFIDILYSFEKYFVAKTLAHTALKFSEQLTQAYLNYMIFLAEML